MARLFNMAEEPRGSAVGWPARGVAGVALSLGLGGGLAAYARYLEPRWLRVRAWEVEVRDLQPAWDGFRIVQLSDFHLGGPGVRLSTLRRAIHRAVELGPDLVALTGDFMHGGRWRLEGEGLFEPLVHAAPVYAVLGNHDQLSGADDAALIGESLRRQGVHVLRNAWALAGPEGSEAVIAGLDDPVTGHADLLKAVRGKPDGMAPLLLAHAPDIVEQVPQGWFRLALAGHTHGAQIRLSPLERISWLQVGIAEISSRYPRGFYNVNGLVLYVNQGLGMSELPLRFAARPEITLLILRPSRGSVREPWRRIKAF